MKIITVQTAYKIIIQLIIAVRAYKTIKKIIIQLITAVRAYKIIKKMFKCLPPFQTAVGRWPSTGQLQPAIAAL